MNKRKILVSACLLGEHVRYDGEIPPNCPPILKELEQQGWDFISVCPEVFGGLPVPRPPAEIQGEDGKAVIDGAAKVVDINGHDVSAAFIKGAQEALQLAEENEVVCALLKARSPSCGNKRIYDGSYCGRLKEGQGVTAALIKSAGIQVYNEDETDQLAGLIGTGSAGYDTRKPEQHLPS